MSRTGVEGPGEPGSGRLEGGEGWVMSGCVADGHSGTTAAGSRPSRSISEGGAGAGGQGWRESLSELAQGAQERVAGGLVVEELEIGLLGVPL